MANYNNLKTAIQDVIKANGNQEIEGDILQNALLSIINSLGAGYQFIGVATTKTNPGTPDQKVFYIANGKGPYSNFSGINVDEDEVVVLYWDSSWHKVSTGIASNSMLTELDAQVSNIGIENTSQGGLADLDIADEKGLALARFADGHIKTKNFDSSVTPYVKQKPTSTSDLDFADENGNILVRFADGHIRTKKFNSAKLSTSFRTFSVLGDSYSTYAGFIPSGNVTWYPTSAPGEGLGLQNDVDSVKQCWWHLFANEVRCTLIQNESWSGACICYDSYGSGATDGKTKSFVQRVSKVGKSDLIIIEGGTNDSWAGASMGNYKYSDWNESDFETYRPSLAYVLNYAQEHNPGSTIIFMLNNGLSQEIIESTETICAYYDVNLLKLYNISKQSNHPNKAGMIQIKNQLIEYINNLIL